MILASKDDIREAVKMVKEGANDYLSYPIDSSEARLVIDTTMTLAEARQVAVEDFERQYLKELFSRTKGMVNLAAKEACISTRQLNNC